MATVTDIGIEAVAKLITGVDGLDPFTFMGNGSGTTAEGVTQTALVTENTLTGSARKSATCTYIAPGISEWVALFTFSGSVTINEIAIFNAISAGVMLLRHKLGAQKQYSDGESVQITVTTTTARV